MDIRQFLNIILLLCLIMGCGRVNLIDISNSTSALQLTDKQQQVIHPKMKLIQDIVDDYDFEKRHMESDLREYRIIDNDRQLNRNDGGLSTAQRQRRLSNVRIKIRKFLTHRNILLKEIGKLLQEITSELSPNQLSIFKELRMPKLKIPQRLRRDHDADLRYIPRNPLGIY